MLYRPCDASHPMMSRMLDDNPPETQYLCREQFWARFDSFLSFVHLYKADDPRKVRPPLAMEGCVPALPAATGCFLGLKRDSKRTVVYRRPVGFRPVACRFPGCTAPRYNANVQTIVFCTGCRKWYHDHHLVPYDEELHREAKDDRRIIPAAVPGGKAWPVPAIVRAPAKVDAWVHVMRGLSLNIGSAVQSNERPLSVLEKIPADELTDDREALKARWVQMLGGHHDDDDDDGDGDDLAVCLV